MGDGLIKGSAASGKRTTDRWWCGLISVTCNDGESVDVHEDFK
jgi:hypothetical protein